MRQVAKLFTNGRSQTVRLPSAFRFDTKEVFIRQDAETGGVIWSHWPSPWDGFLEVLKNTDVPRDFSVQKNANKNHGIVIHFTANKNEGPYIEYQHCRPFDARAAGRRGTHFARTDVIVL